MDKHEKELKLSLVKATESIRNKYKELFNEKSANKHILEEQYKPITSKLSSLIEVNRVHEKEIKNINELKNVLSGHDSLMQNDSSSDADDVMEFDDIDSDH